MPPKKTNSTSAADIHHLTFHFFKAAVLLSVSASTLGRSQLIDSTVTELKSQLLVALSVPSIRAILASSLPHIPADSVSEADFRLYETLEDTVEGGTEVIDRVRSIEGDKKEMAKTIRGLGWDRWKTITVSFKNEDGASDDPIAEIPNVDEEGEESL